VVVEEEDIMEEEEASLIFNPMVPFIHIQEEEEDHIYLIQILLTQEVKML
jgi:hypothetical protein